MKFVLDTCIISEAVRPRPNPAVLAWLAEQNESDLLLCSLTLGELGKGIERLRRGGKRSTLENWLLDLERRFASRVLPIDGSVALHWGHLDALLASGGRPLPVVDGLIAACAITQGAVLATRNVKDFVETGVELFNPWDLGKK
ncbi:MAG: type II toxin-antitoxin system VapC family toxin [Spirochaetota bacterium]